MLKLLKRSRDFLYKFGDAAFLTAVAFRLAKHCSK